MNLSAFKLWCSISWDDLSAGYTSAGMASGERKQTNVELDEKFEEMTSDDLFTFYSGDKVEDVYDSDEELIQDTTTSKRRTVQDEGHTTPVSSRSSTSTCTCTYAYCSLARVSCDVLLLGRRGLTGKRRVVCQPNLADNFENVGYICVRRSIFTGPQVQIPPSPYEQGLGLVRG